MKYIYLDNNATTKVDKQVLYTMLPYLKDEFGNPSSAYRFSDEVKIAIMNAREKIAQLLHAKMEEIIFTSCATESNTTAIMSAVKANPNKKHLITTKIEHASIIETMKVLEDEGYKITYLTVDEKGRLNLEELKRAIQKDTLLISVMYANNEIGNIYPIEKIGKIAKEKNILFHVDAVQAIGKIDVNVETCHIDMLSFSGHKIHAPKGIGVLYKRKNVPFFSLIHGHQEQNLRGGTENVAYIVGLGKAVDIILKDNHVDKIKKLRDYLETTIKEKISGVIFFGDLENRTANTTNLSFDGIKGEDLLQKLDELGIYISIGSACNAGLAAPSHVLGAMKVNFEKHSPIRISLSKYTTKKEITIFLNELEKIIQNLRNKK